MNAPYMRGHVYRVAYGELGQKPFVVVSNNQRNRKLDSVLGVRVTTTDKSFVPTAVELGSNDPLNGYALADDIRELYEEELDAGTFLGSLSPRTMLTLNQALAQALGIP